MRSIWKVENVMEAPLPSGFEGPDVRFSTGFVEQVLSEYTQPGEVVFDPFSGFGTTLVVAEQMGRIPAGIEWDVERYQYTHSRLSETRWFHHGDSRCLADFPLPSLDFSLSSPPYMNRNDSEDPLTNYAAPHTNPDGYAAYLDSLKIIYSAIGERLRPGGRVAVEVANLRSSGTVTPLAWDIARTLSDVLTYEGETILDWSPTYGFGYDHSYLLLFHKR